MSSTAGTKIQINKLQLKPLALYIHIPFCVRKCDYCDFLSAQGSSDDIKRYVEALINEIKLYSDFAKGYVVKSVFFGGGTPSILSTVQMDKIMGAIRDLFYIEKTAEITVECNPGTVDYEKAVGYRKLGINRISIGLQSTHDDELKSIGRIHTYGQFLECYNIFRKAGFDNINIDLISALPNQKVDKYKESLKRIIELEPEHISAYSLIVEEGTKLYKRIENEQKNNIYSLPSEDDERLMYEMTGEILKDVGYGRYEISNYAKKGRECIHNKAYWIRQEYVGIGLGAASLVEERRISKIRNLQEYLKILETKDVAIEDLYGSDEQLSQNEQIEETMFLGLRLMEGVRKKDFSDKFGLDIHALYNDIINKLVDDKLIVETEDTIQLTNRGIDVSNYVMSEFLLD